MNQRPKPLSSLFLTLILLVTLLSRTIATRDTPPGLNRDEAAIGYTAYSILKTGRDEHGIFLPISVKSFGDWKLPLYIYLTVPTVAIFGLTEVAVRLPSVIVGTLTVWLTYLIALEFFRRKTVALLSALLLAVSPWNLFFSRVASEANLAVFITTLALYVFIKTKLNRWGLPISAILFGLTLFTYHGNHVFTPLFFGALVLLYRFRFRSLPGAVSLAVFVVMAVSIFSLTLSSADKTKLSGLIALNDPSLIHESIVKNRLILKDSFFNKLLYNKGVYFIEHVAQNYLKSWSPEFLFIRGGGNFQHNIPDFGNLYLIEAPFILMGLYFLFAAKDKNAKILLVWLLIAPLGAVLTKDAPHSARQVAILPGLTIVCAYGIAGTLKTLQQQQIRLATGLFVAVLYLGSTLIFFTRYFSLFPYKSAVFWGVAMKEMVEKLIRYQELYVDVTVARPDYSPYIYYLFYTMADPRQVQESLIHYPPTDEGFEHVRQFANINYQKINWTDELLLPNRLYVDWVEGIPSGATMSAVLITRDEADRLATTGKGDTPSIGTRVSSRIIDEVRLPDGQPLFYFIETFVDTSPQVDNSAYGILP